MFCYCAEARRLARLLTARYDAQLAEAGISAAQFELLSVLATMKRGNGKALAEQLAVDPTTLSRNLKVLLTQQLVDARRSSVDARQTEYSLTGKGLKRLAIAVPLWQQAHAATRDAVGAQADPLQQALVSMAGHLRA